MKKLTTEYKVLLALCVLVTIMGVCHLIFISSIESLVVTIMCITWFVAIDTPHHDKYVTENDTDFRDR